MTRSRQRPLRGLTLLIVALLSTAGALGAVAPAHAATAASLPDPSKAGSLTIHKFATPDTATGLPHDGTQVDTSGLTPIAAVTFSVQQVGGIDLTTNSGWQKADALSKTYNAADATGSITSAGYGLTSAQGSPVTTNASGTASLAGLPLGLYLVTETSWPAGATPSAPFLVSVPLTDPTTHNSWLYDVDVYPKNATTTVAKTVSDASATKLGDPLSWTIAADIPNLDTIDGYKVTDQLDAKLDYASTAVSLADGTTVAQGTDYTADYDASSRTLTVSFTAAGRAVLAAHDTSQVLVKVVTTVHAVGEITNTALLYPNQASFSITPGQPGGPVVTPPVQTKWGSLTVQKTDPDGTALGGAVFSVYATQADAEAGNNPIALAGQTTFTAGTDGTVTISGLRYSDFADGQTVTAGSAGYRDYWLAEVQAPAGYELLADPVKFDVTAQTSTVGVDLKVQDVPSNSGFALPFTGGPGGRLVYLGGGLSLAGALVIALGRRRRTGTAS
ncbi:SpaH/EbpB family LPXTG-anchored major pilin [Nocardioides sp. BP30]|uniref:SpaH/EbpB family LPXTG-anchored major pilin n=1 Tax=Nocardioides sp. BP30 TaxID=3036374 RepID=UPI0024693EED|nr:SpaH/EbpB family LPXTG-anchored major pilin [Nocardioides sp. BP30]WGL50371.1 SpaH/EbpB family LPXTG-anchored major pilin [Nocardioides sp. BP30]